MTAVLSAASVILGAVVGSFLNACIHRMPRDIRLSDPKRSFCPSCNKLIPWYENVPVASWLVLRGKCSGCGARISPRYLFVEILTAAAFFSLWQKFALPLGPVYWVFISLLIAATFIDIEHFIIPDQITWGGTVAGILFSLGIPELMGTGSRLVAGGLSVGGAALGFVLLWLVVEGGKLAFGRKRHVFDPPEAFGWARDGDRADIRVGADSLAWEDLFSRESDVLILEADGPILIDGRETAGGTLRFHYDKLISAAGEFALDGIGTVAGRLRAIVIPREAMGFGDVKFIACIGAFLGWQAVLFTIFSASIVGCIAGIAGIFLARDKAGTRVPFGPFLALGAAMWLFGGRELTAWYFTQFQVFQPVPLLH